MEKRKMGLLFAFSMLLAFMMCFSCVYASTKYEVKAEAKNGKVAIDNAKFSSSTSKKVEKGTNVKITWQAKSGYVFSSVKVNDTDMTNNVVNNSIEGTITKKTKIKVIFKEMPKVEVKASNGTVSVNGAEFASSKEIKVPEGTKIKITWRPKDGYMFSSVKVNDKDMTNNVVDNSIEGTITKKTKIKVKFSKIEKCKIDISLNNKKYGSVSADDNSNLYMGMSRSFTVKPADNYIFGSASISSGKAALKVDIENNKFILENIQSEKIKVKVNFVKDSSTSAQPVTQQNVMQQNTTQQNIVQQNTTQLETQLQSGQSDKVADFLREAGKAAQLALNTGTGYKSGGTEIGQNKKIDCIGYVNYALNKANIATLGSSPQSWVDRARRGKIGDIIEVKNDNKIGKYEIVYVRQKGASLDTSIFRSLQKGDILVSAKSDGRSHIEIFDGLVSLSKNKVKIKKFDWTDWSSISSTNQFKLAKSAYAKAASYEHEYEFSGKISLLGAVLRIK